MFTSVAHIKCGLCHLGGNSRLMSMDDTFETQSQILCRMLCLALVVKNSAYVSIINGSFAQFNLRSFYEKVTSFCWYYSTSSASTHVAENYLLALCESDRKKELLQLLEIVDIMKLSPPNSVANIFRSLGRLSLESSAENFLMAFKNYSMFIKHCYYFSRDFDISFFIQGIFGWDNKQRLSFIKREAKLFIYCIFANIFHF